MTRPTMSDAASCGIGLDGKDWYSNDEPSAAAYEAARNETTRLQEALDNGYEPEGDR